VSDPEQPGPDPLADLRDLVDGQTGIVSIDTDFFVQRRERALAGRLAAWLAAEVAAGVPVTCREDHVDLVDLVRTPVEVCLNFDSHMDLSVGYLLGDDPRVPPEDATVFETILAAGLTRRYIWAHPASRSRAVASVYAGALVAGRQRALNRIHCLSGEAALHVLDGIRTDSVFVCRSPGYETAETAAVYRRLCSIAAGTAR
jgi:hypothetical protein